MASDGKREREIARRAVKDDDRQDVSQDQPEATGQHPDHGRVEQQDLHGHQPRRAVRANVFDQLAPRGHGDQHRVEREHEADERADPGEQVLALALRRHRDREQARVEFGR